MLKVLIASILVYQFELGLWGWVAVGVTTIFDFIVGGINDNRVKDNFDLVLSKFNTTNKQDNTTLADVQYAVSCIESSVDDLKNNLVEMEGIMKANQNTIYEAIYSSKDN